MTEADRKQIVSKIQTEIEESKSLIAKYEELKKMIEEPTVVKYLKLLNDIASIADEEEKYRSPIDGTLNDSLEARIQFWFRVGRFDCEHKVWLYAGSYYIYDNFKNDGDYVRYNSENCSDNLRVFSYNKYVCLECREEIKVPKSDWKEFEESHFVLKIQDRIDIEYYQNLYYQLLYHNYDFADAQNMVIDEFNQNKQKRLINNH